MLTQSDGSNAADSEARCVLSPEMTEGPYYIDDAIFRRNVKEGEPGEPLELRLRVEDSARCRPIRNAVVEIWHANAGGVYSGFGEGAGEPSFLRGQQRTDRDGKVVFKTIYPGWYTGRAVHIHLKVHVGGSEVHTGQLFFNEALTERVMARSPYAGQPDTVNSTDGIFSQGGSESILRIHRARGGNGFIGAMTLVVQS